MAWLVALLPAGAGAEQLQLLGPDSTVSPDGFEVAAGLVGADGRYLDASKVTLEASGASVSEVRSEGPLRVARLVPSEATVQLHAKWGAAEAHRTFQVGPPAARVSLRLEPAAPVKSRDTSAELTIEMKNSSGQPDAESAPPVLRANVGSIEALRKVGIGLYQATYVLPTTRFPEVAVVVAFSAWPHAQSVHGAFGALRVPLAAAVELPGKTESNAELTLNIAGKPYGPVKTGPDGRFKVPIVVPPGYGMASGTAVDRLGNRRSNPIDLMLPPTDQLACVVSPTQLPADGQSRARVLCASSDAFGNIATGAKVGLVVARGKLGQPRSLDNGVTEWTWVAPAELGNGQATFSATWKQGGIAAREDLEVKLVQGPAATATVSVSEAFVHLGGSIPVAADVKDAQGRPRAGARLALVSLAGALEELAESAGKTTARWRAPVEGRVGATQVSFRAWGPLGSEPARISTWVEAGKLWAAVTDLAGLPVPAQPLRTPKGDAVSDAEGLLDLGSVVDGDVLVRHRDWPGLSATTHVREGGQMVFPRGTRPGSAPANVQLTLGPAVPVVVRLAVEGRRVSFWAESPDGKLLPDRVLKAEVSSGVAGPTTVKDGRARFEVSGLSRKATVSVVDVETQVLALGEIAP